MASVLIPTLSNLCLSFLRAPYQFLSDSSNQLTMTQKVKFEHHQQSAAKIKQHVIFTAFTSGIFLLISIPICFSQDGKVHLSTLLTTELFHVSLP